MQCKSRVHRLKLAIVHSRIYLLCACVLESIRPMYVLYYKEVFSVGTARSIYIIGSLINLSVKLLCATCDRCHWLDNKNWILQYVVLVAMLVIQCCTFAHSLFCVKGWLFKLALCPPPQSCSYCLSQFSPSISIKIAVSM